MARKRSSTRGVSRNKRKGTKGKRKGASQKRAKTSREVEQENDADLYGEAAQQGFDFSAWDFDQDYDIDEQIDDYDDRDQDDYPEDE